MWRNLHGIALRNLGRKQAIVFELFKKKAATDEAWRLVAAQARPLVEEIGKNMGTAGTAVGNDHVSGWMSVTATLVALDSTKEFVQQLEKLFKQVGKPAEGSQYSVAHKAVEAFFEQMTYALHWGKYHYSDASGGPGQRALTETGFAQRAALKRINNNGSKFADAAKKAAFSAKLFADELTK